MAAKQWLDYNPIEEDEKMDKEARSTMKTRKARQPDIKLRYNQVKITGDMQRKTVATQVETLLPNDDPASDVSAGPHSSLNASSTAPCALSTSFPSNPASSTLLMNVSDPLPQSKIEEVQVPGALTKDLPVRDHLAADLLIYEGQTPRAEEYQAEEEDLIIFD
jgi:hypothetical protein